MKRYRLFEWLGCSLVCCVWLAAPAVADETVVVAPASEAAEGLDLHAVAELFRQSSTVEDFERRLNDPETGVNNLDLDGDGQVDFIRVVEQVDGGTHVLILQGLLTETEFQEVASIEIEQSGDDYHFQVHGALLLYGPDYYIVPPPGIYVSTWPVITWIYRPVYRPYVSVWYVGHWPRWWRPRTVVSINIYRPRVVHWTSTTSFTVTRTTRVRTATRVYKSPTNSPTVKRRVTRSTVPSGPTKQRAKVTRTTTNPATGKTTIKKTRDPASGKTKKTTKRKASKTKKKPGKSGKKKPKRRSGSGRVYVGQAAFSPDLRVRASLRSPVTRPYVNPKPTPEGRARGGGPIASDGVSDRLQVSAREYHRITWSAIDETRRGF